MLIEIIISLAYAEMYLALAILFRRFSFELYDTIRERDIDLSRDYFVGETKKESPGARIKIVSEN